MSDIVQELTIEATPENVFHALTLPDGIAGWWSNHVTAELQVGSLFALRMEGSSRWRLPTSKSERKCIGE